MTSLSDAEIVNAPGGLVELGYITAGVNVTITATGGTTVGTTTGVIGPITVVCDGSPVIVDFYTPYVYPASVAGAFVNLVIFKDGAFAGYIGSTQTPAASTDSKTMYFQFRDTPTAGTHTYEIRAYRDGGAGTAIIIGAAAAGWAATFLRVSKIIQASQLLVTQSNAPIVTTLPSGNLITGQEVQLYSATPYAGYQRQMYDGTQWNIMDDSRAIKGWQSYSPTVTQSATVTFTVNYSSYMQMGKTVFWSFYLTYLSGTGTAGNALTITLPVACTSTTRRPLGGGQIYYNVTPRPYQGMWINAASSNNTAIFTSDDTGNNFWGANPSLAISAASNMIYGFLVYEAA